MNIAVLKEKAINENGVSKQEAIELFSAELRELRAAAEEIRKKRAGNSFSICAIINAKSGRCPENCKYCAQSSFYSSGGAEYSLMGLESVAAGMKACERNGVRRCALVTSGRALDKTDLESVSEIYSKLSESCGVKLCASHGLLGYAMLVRLKNAGVSRYHNNLETSRAYFPKVCTTHNYDDKIATIKAAQKAGLEVCSGGIIGMGETFEDRADMACELRELGIRSIPLNVLNPIKGTPFEKLRPLSVDEISRTAAVFRFMLPDAFIRMAGGRGQLKDSGRAVFMSGANAAISGDMLTTTGVSMKKDMAMIKELGFEVC